MSKPANTQESFEALQQRLVRAARRERPSRGAYDRTAAALGIDASLNEGMAKRIGKKNGVGSWVAIGLLAASGTGWWGAHEWNATRLAASNVQAGGPPVVDIVPAPAAVADGLATGGVAGNDSPSTSPNHEAAQAAEALSPPSTPPEPTSPGASGSSPSARTPESRKTHSLSEELVILKDARAALASQDAARALHRLSDYYAKFPSGILKIEADVVRIDALMAAGRSKEAKERARAFLKQVPNSPQAAHVSKVTGIAASSTE